MNALRRPWEASPEEHAHCDVCGGTASVHVRVNAAGHLSFCEHHYARHEAAVIERGYAVRDERRELDDDVALALVLALAAGQDDRT